MLERVIERVWQAKLVDDVVLAVPHTIPVPYPQIVYEDEPDVLRRYVIAAKERRADIIIRITSDCPLIDPEIIDYAISYREKTGLPYVIFAPVDGLDVEVFTMDMLLEADKNTTSQSDREHVTPYMRRRTKMSVDSLENLERVRKIWNGEIKLYS